MLAPTVVTAYGRIFRSGLRMLTGKAVRECVVDAAIISTLDVCSRMAFLIVLSVPSLISLMFPRLSGVGFHAGRVSSHVINDSLLPPHMSYFQERIGLAKRIALLTQNAPRLFQDGQGILRIALHRANLDQYVACADAIA